MKSEATVPAAEEIPALRAVTRPLDKVPDLLGYASGSHPLFWNRGDRGCVGIGEALRLVFRGKHRFLDASRVWREIASRAQIDDPVQMPGSGLVAFGTFAFADESAAESVLIVPRLLINRHRGVAWITEVSVVSQAESAVGGSADPELPERTAFGHWPGAELHSLSERPTDSDPTDPRVVAAERASTIAAYLAGVDEAARRIGAGEVEKVVLSRQIAGELPANADLRVPLERLSSRYLDCWTFAVDGLIGASPETLVRSTSGAVSARVLAGTRGRHADDAVRDRGARDELLRSAKEQHEHDFAVQSVITALAPHVNELRTSDEPFALQLPNVWHLATDLGASLGEDTTALELVDALHPTAAVAGTPTADAVALIAELEPFDRERYSGAVGWIDAQGDGEWVIALRCAQVSDVQSGASSDAIGTRTVVASAGGGIVAGSDPQHELGETVSKFRPVTDAFASA